MNKTIAHISFKSPVDFFQNGKPVKHVSVEQREYVSEYTENVGFIYIASGNNRPIECGQDTESALRIIRERCGGFKNIANVEMKNRAANEFYSLLN
jgi:hypothetical protein